MMDSSFSSSRQQTFRLAPFPISCVILFFMGICGFAGFGIPDGLSLLEPLVYWFRNIGLLIFRSERNLQIVFLLANITHFFEALYAASLSMKANFPWQSTAMWFVQTFMVGYPSIKLVKKLAAKKRASKQT
mmetsp:Transcript_19228/g.30253  ORF Transcript_19228/g.30253 Transcript_19228/m.30253 type:complete len:131 (-) Transcript_19228:197-589(-)